MENNASSHWNGDSWKENHQAKEIVPDTPSFRVAWLSSPGCSELPPSLFSGKNAQFPVPSNLIHSATIKGRRRTGPWKHKEFGELQRRYSTDLSTNHVFNGEHWLEYLSLSIWDKAWFPDYIQHRLRKAYEICILNHHKNFFSICKKMNFFFKKRGPVGNNDWT